MATKKNTKVTTKGKTLSRPNTLSYGKFVSSFSSMKSAKIAKTLVSASHSYDADILGYFLIPMLRERLSSEWRN